MELSSDNLFAFVIRRYKQKENKNSRGQSPRMQMTIKQNSPKKDEKIIKNNKVINYFHALIINNSNISNVLYNSFDPFIKECFNNLEFLSIANNYIRNLDFLQHLPNLFFLDLFGNPLEEINALNNKNIFGYLRLSIESFNEKKILNIFDLKCSILEIYLKDKNTMKLFGTNNHHISMINNEVIYLIDLIKIEEDKMKNYSKKNKKLKRGDTSMMSLNSNSNADSSNSDLKRESSKHLGSGIVQFIKNLSNKNIQGGKNDYILETPKENIEIKNPFLLKIKKFFNDYENEINKSLQNEYRMEVINKRNILLKDSETFSSQNLVNNKKYLRHERDKLILLFETYKKISVFNRQKNDNEFYVGNTYNINVNKHIDGIFVKEIKDNIMNRSQIPRTSIIILISIAFYTIGTISDKMMNAIINYILTKYYDYDENQKFPDFSNLGDIHYLAFYYSTYNYIYKRMIDNEKNISIDKYKDILNILQMDKLILKSNYLYKKLKANKLKDNKEEFSEYKKFKINNEIQSIKKLNISKEFLVLLEFLCDYIIYEKIEDILINNSSSGEYSYLIELKETLEENEFKINNNNFTSSSSLSALKFQKNKKERIFNKFYFAKDKIKQIKNKDFKNYVYDYNKSRTLNNFSTAMGNNSLLNNSYSNFYNINNNNNILNEENEYNKVDDIDVDEFFYIENKGRNSNNKICGKRTNYNISLYKTKDKENDCYNENSFDDENNSSIKLPNLYQNQMEQAPYEEFEFFKRMIFDPDFLSQHARNVIKFEKKKKKLQKRYPKINIRNKSFKNTIERSKINESKTTKKFENNNISNINFFGNKNTFHIESTSNENNGNLYNSKIVLNSSNSNLFKCKMNSPVNFKFSSKINFKITDAKEKDKFAIDQNNKTELIFNRKCNLIKHNYKGPFSEVPESFPGITLLNFGIKRNKTQVKRIKLYEKKSPSKEEKKEDKKKSYKQKVMSKIKQTIKDNILRNARRVAYPMYQN